MLGGLRDPESQTDLPDRFCVLGHELQHSSTRGPETAFKEVRSVFGQR
jgi:hypothetical protein